MTLTCCIFLHCQDQDKNVLLHASFSKTAVVSPVAISTNVCGTILVVSLEDTAFLEVLQSVRNLLHFQGLLFSQDWSLGPSMFSPHQDFLTWCSCLNVMFFNYKVGAGANNKKMMPLQFVFLGVHCSIQKLALSGLHPRYQQGIQTCTDRTLSGE